MSRTLYLLVAAGAMLLFGAHIVSGRSSPAASAHSVLVQIIGTGPFTIEYVGR